MFRAVSLSIIRIFSTVHSAIIICHTGYADCLLEGSEWSILIPLASSQHNLYDIYLLLYVQCSTPDYWQRNCPKHLEFYSKNKFEKLLHLVGFIRIYHDARSSECPKLIHRCIIGAAKIPAGARDFLFSTFVQTGSENNTPSYSVSTLHPHSPRG